MRRYILTRIAAAGNRFGTAVIISDGFTCSVFDYTELMLQAKKSFPMLDSRFASCDTDVKTRSPALRFGCAADLKIPGWENCEMNIPAVQLQSDAK